MERTEQCVIDCVGETFGHDGEIIQHVARWLSVQYRREKYTFSNAPLGEANRFLISDKDFARTFACETHHPMSNVTLKSALIRRNRLGGEVP
jgi:hypothetical protein